MWPFRRRAAPPHPKDRRFPTRDGIWVRSLGEQRIANLLSRRGIAYEYEPALLGFRPDFVLRDHHVVIEYWGGAGFDGYAAHAAKKIAAYEDAGYAVVSLVPVNLRYLERELLDRLQDVGALD